MSPKSTNTEKQGEADKSQVTQTFSEEWKCAAKDYNVSRNEQEGMLARIFNDGDDDDGDDDDVGMESCSHLNTDTEVLTQCCLTTGAVVNSQLPVPGKTMTVDRIA